jgi:hypothetical protein
MRVSFLLGAGCPMAIRSGESGAPLIPDILTLTSTIKTEIEAEKDKNSHNSTITRVLDFFPNPDSATIEHILSQVRSLIEIIQKEYFGDITKTDLKELDKKICQIITRCVGATLPDASPITPYHQLGNWISAISREHPVELFTTNYDLLVEQAFEELSIPYFDGFNGSNRAFFDLSSIENDKLPSRWARLWKLHGSINWWRSEGGKIERRLPSDAGEQQMIYPSHLKYQQSRRLPYLAMLDRLKFFLAPGKGPSVLVTCGYSFADEHINGLLIDSLRGNPSAVCYCLLYEDLEKEQYKEARLCAKKQPNLRILAKNGAIIGTTEDVWHRERKEPGLLNGFVKQTITPAPGVTDQGNSEDEIKHDFMLGNFASLGSFLLQQCGQFAQQETSTPLAHVALI